jgi:two-component system KDP operon response regulator KdpE
LLARVRVALRHVAQPDSGADPVLRVGGLELDIERRRVLRDGHPVHLTPTEYELLKVFATHPERFLSDRTLINAVWGPAWQGGEHILHVYVGRLRRKLEDDAAVPRHVLTESGLGYRFVT